MWQGLLHRYEAYLPVTEKTPALTLHEGNTPLLPIPTLSKELGIEGYVKIEGANPTGSFKDRGMVMAMAKAIEEGSKAVICASTGNTSASAAAFAARAGLRCIVVIPDGKIAQGKLAQAVMYGAEIFAIKGNFDQALQMVRDIAEKEPITLVNSVNPYRIEGQKTAAFEVCDALGEAPDVLSIPVGNAGNITAYWKGFKEYHEKNGFALPKMMGFEASGSAAIVRNQIIEDPETLATAIRIGNPASWDKAVRAKEESNGLIDEVTDEEIVEAYQLLAQKEGVFAEPASCASIAGMIKKVKSGEIPQGAKVVHVLTGNGLKDPNTAIDTSPVKPTVIENDIEEFKSALSGVTT
ncbi:threonine synthase [Halobacillus litoralis]|uniref:threonine synthase n=1 Tax=Halobacillus litoralis TaxID=45668 RepID=UPI001CD70528|nr:threonine synthase [Halobacillus litoralis]MCA0971538.1 threonine synthase [Halobacillus litoralis]